jgi:hypothetical protein
VEITDVFLVENATQCYFDSVNFVGPLTTSSITADPAGDDIAGVRFASTASLVCNQITFDKCRFAGLNYGINTDQEINSITVSNSKFEILYQGITLGTSTPVNGGATGFRAVHNMFDLVYAQGIVYDLVDLNVTAYNVFYDVGNNYTSNPVVAVIEFGNDNNASISDMFERSNDEANAVSRVLVTGASTTTGTQIQIGRYARENGRTQSLGNNQSNQTIFTTDTATIKAFQMTYTIQRDIAIRFGTLIVTAQNSDDSSLTLAYADDFTENIDTGITLAVSQSSNVITVKYSSTNTGLIGTLTYSLSYLS